MKGHGRTATQPVSALRLITAFALAATVTLGGCGDDDPAGPGPGPSTVLILVGVVNGNDAGLSGSISLTIDNGSVSGSFKRVSPSALTVTLTGSYNASTRAISASGGGYSFSGTYDGSAVASGTFNGPNASAGSFTARKSNGSARAFCGTFTSQTGSDNGIFNIAIDGAAISGTATTEDGTVLTLSGALSGNAISISHPNGGSLATGTLNGSSVSGTFDDRAGNRGTWTGAVCS